MRQLVWTEVIVFLSISLSLFSAKSQVTLVQVTPEEGDPICWNSKLTYNCTVRAGHLIWDYTGMDVDPLALLSLNPSVINEVLPLGPFNVVLLSIEPTNDTFNMESTLTIRDQLTADIDGQNISCLGTMEVVRTISIAGLNVTNVSVCSSTIFWNPPPCDANCTILVDGQEIDTVPCSDGSLTTGEPSLGIKNLSIHATDPLGRSVLVQNNHTEVPLVSSLLPSTDATITSMPTATTNVALIVGIPVLLVLISISVVIAILVCYYFKRRVQKGGVVAVEYNKHSDVEVCIGDKKDPTEDDKRRILVGSQLGPGQQPVKGNNVTQAPKSTNNVEKPVPPKKFTGPSGKQGFASSNARGDRPLATQNQHSDVPRETGGDHTTKRATVGVSKNPQPKKPDSHVSGNANTNHLTQSATVGLNKNQQPKKSDSHVSGNANTNRLTQSATDGVNKNQQPKKRDSHGVTQGVTPAITRNSPVQKQGGHSSRKPEIDCLTPGATVNGSKTPPTNRGDNISSRKAENGHLTNKPNVVHPTGSAAQDGNHTPSDTILERPVPEELKGGRSTDSGPKDGGHNPPAKEEPPVVGKPQGKISKMLVVDGEIKVYKPGMSSIVHCKLSPDAAFIAIVDSDWKVSVLRCNSGDKVTYLRSSSCVLSLEWLELDDRNSVLMFANCTKLKIIDIEKDKELVDFKLKSLSQDSRIICTAHCATQSVFALSCLPQVRGKESDGDDCSGLLIIGDHKKGEDKMKCSVKVKSPVTCMVFNNDGTQLITGNEDGKLTMYDVQVDGNQYNAKPRYDWSKPHGTVYNVQYSYDEQYVYSIGKSDEFFLQSKMTDSGSPDPTSIKINPGAVSIIANTEEGFPICGQFFSLMQRKNYVLTSSSSQGVIFKVKGGKNAVKKLTLDPFDAHITCVDWKPADDVGFVGVMGCADNSVHVMKIVHKE